MTQVEMLEQAKKVLLSKFGTMPKYVVTLGSGLSSLLDELKVEGEILYSEIPHVKSPTVKEHVGKYVVGEWNGVRVGCMRGRLHYYEGHTMAEVVFPFRALAWAGSKIFFLTNATGGMRADMSPLDLLLVRDHINLMGGNPLIGANDERLGVRFPDTTQLYNPDCNRIILETAKRLGVPLKEGVYVALHGPSFETPAEIEYYRRIGGDVAGMSTVPEAIALHHMGKIICAVSCITNLAAGMAGPILHEEVMLNAKKAYRSFASLIGQSIKAMEESL